MPGTDARGARPAAGSGQSSGGSAEEGFRGKDAGGGAGKHLSGDERDGQRGGAVTHSEDRSGRTALGKQTVGGAFDQHVAGTRGRPFQPPAILRAPSSLVSHPLFLHPVPQLGAPFRAPSLPPPLPAPILFDPPAGAPQPPIPAVIVLAPTQTQTQTQTVPQTTQPPVEVPSPKVELSVTSSAIDTAPPSPETPSSASAVSTAASPAPSLSVSTTSASPPDIVPLALATGEPVAASLVDTSFTNAETSDIIPVTNSSLGVGGKVAAGCVIGAVFLLLLNWAFWLVIRRRRRARRSLPAHWDFAAPKPRAKGRDSEDAFSHAEDEPVKGGMGTIPV